MKHCLRTAGVAGRIVHYRHDGDLPRLLGVLHSSALYREVRPCHPTGDHVANSGRGWIVSTRPRDVRPASRCEYPIGRREPCAVPERAVHGGQETDPRLLIDRQATSAQTLEYVRPPGGDHLTNTEIDDYETTQLQDALRVPSSLQQDAVNWVRFLNQEYLATDRRISIALTNGKRDVELTSD